MNWLKIVTRKGRQSLARELLKENLTSDTIAKWAANGTNSLLERINNKEGLDKIATTTEKAATLVSCVSAAVKDGHVSNDEALAIQTTAHNLVGAAITPEQVNALIDRVVAKIP